MAELEILIRGGTVVDGTGLPKFTADVGIRGGLIAEIGRIDAARADRVLDADGLVVAPGCVDLHTHYDAQIQWDPWCSISGWHGVTSVVLGNCGFGFAPVRPPDRERAMLTMSRTEAIALAAMREGMLWDWETFPEWLDTLERIPKGVNCLSYTPVLPLMVYVMGMQAAKSRPATTGEREEMQRLLGESMRAGSCGWSVQRMGPHSVQADFDGTPMPTDTMGEEELRAFARVLRGRGEGFIQITQSSEPDLDANFAVCERLAEISGRPVLFNTVLAVNGSPWLHRRYVEWLADCHRRGLPVYGQAASVRQPFHLMLRDWNLFDIAPGWNRALQGTLEEKQRNLRDEAIRRRLVREYDEGRIPVAVLGGRIEDYVIEGAPRAPELDPYVGRTVGEVAAAKGLHPVECLLDLSLASELEASFLTQSASSDDPRYVAELLASPYVVAGISDGGAHAKFAAGGAYTTDLLEWLVREEGLLSVEQAHQKLAFLPARAAGFRHRGALLEGAPADVIVYDLSRIQRVPAWWQAEIAHDLPGGEWRRVQRAKGYHWTLVNGVVTFEGDRCTGATPGRLLRHGRG
jgi:N-acyl-D-aspartate/D-glutamate deacylase